MTKPAKRTASSGRTATEIDVEIGARIRARRLEIGMAQEELADSLGLTFQQIQKYERGINRVASGTLVLIAEALDTPATSLLGEERPSSRSMALNGTPSAMELARLFHAMNAAGQRMVLEHARVIAKQKPFKNLRG